MSEVGHILQEVTGVGFLKKQLVDKPKEKQRQAQEAGDAVKREAEQKALLEQQTEEAKKAKRAAIASQPTSGFGANTNLARSFLSSL